MEYRTPSKEGYSDFNEAINVSSPSIKHEDVKHLWACRFGENDGPDWVWIIEEKTGDFGYLSAWCDYTGWDCRSGGEYKNGFKTPMEAAYAVPECSDNKDLLENLLGQIYGMAPYGLS